MDSWVHHHLHVSCLELTEAELDGEEDSLKKLGDLFSFMDFSKAILDPQDISPAFAFLEKGFSNLLGPPLYLQQRNLRI